MKTIFRQCMALLAGTLICSACARADSGADFKTNCAPCHGARGAGDSKLGQNLHVRDLGSAEVQKRSDAELTGIVTKGTGKMPAYGSKLTREQIEELIKYIRSLKK